MCQKVPVGKSFVILSNSDSLVMREGPTYVRSFPSSKDTVFGPETSVSFAQVDELDNKSSTHWGFLNDLQRLGVFIIKGKR